MNVPNCKDKLDELIVMALPAVENKKADEFMAVDTSDVVLSARLEHRINRKIEHYFKHKNESKSQKVTRRVLIALLAAVVLAVVLCISVSGIRDRILNAVFSEHDEFNQYKYEEGASNKDDEIEEYRQPTWVPFDLEGEETINNIFLYSLTYWYNEKRYIAYTQCKQCSAPVIQISNENCIITEEQINGCDGQLYSYTNGGFELMWIDDEYLYKIFSTVDGVTKEDILKMAESVK